MVTDVTETGYYSLLRYRRDASRDEARNLAVLLVDADGRFGGIRSAPLGTVSKRLKDQGLISAILNNLEQQFKSEVKPALRDLQRLHESLQNSLVVTEPQPTLVPNLERTLRALYQAFVSPRAGGSSALTKGVLLGKMVALYQDNGVSVRFDDYLNDWNFDLIIEPEGQIHSVAEVLSFATHAQEWGPAEHDAGHFLYALERLSVRGFGIVQPPNDKSHRNAHIAHDRVLRWFDKAKVDVYMPNQLTEHADALPL